MMHKDEIYKSGMPHGLILLLLTLLSRKRKFKRHRIIDYTKKEMEDCRKA
jgi:hypothetical protein